MILVAAMMLTLFIDYPCRNLKKLLSNRKSKKPTKELKIDRKIEWIIHALFANNWIENYEEEKKSHFAKGSKEQF